jgi:hypothetical protein
MVRQILAVVGAMGLCGCQIPRDRIGPMQHETRVIELGQSELARIELKMGAGELYIEGGSPKLLEADFDYNVPAWKPVVESSSTTLRADIEIRQPEHAGANLGDAEYKWNLRLNDSMPMDIITGLGAGEAKLDLGTVSLRSLRVNMGVGNFQLDLRGNPKRDCDVQIHGGVGNATIYLPAQAGILAAARGGIGNISAEGLERRGDRWVNEAYDRAPVRIHLDIHGGVGNIRMIVQ